MTRWLFHCHILDHIVPALERDEATRAHDFHDVERHALDAMGGLVLGMTVSEPGEAAPDTAPDRRLRLIALEQPLDDETTARGFALREDLDPEAATWRSRRTARPSVGAQRRRTAPIYPPPCASRAELSSTLIAGETFDFTWKPEEVGDLVLSIRYPRFLEHGEVTLRQTWRVR